MKRILLIQPMKFWQMNSADVFLAKKEGDILTINGKITEEDLENEDDTHFLLKACDQLSEDCLYRDLGARKFKKQETFWNEADELIKAHTMTVAGKRLKECIKKANELNIPIYFRQNRDVNIYDSAPLLPTDDVLTPIMEFTGVDGNINYTLKLSCKDDVMTPCEHKLNILSFSPAIVCIDNHISSMPDGFSAKLILPFLTKKNILIPERMKDEYFRKFIIKNAMNADVIVKNMDVEDVEMPRTCIICLERTLNNKAIITLRYRYGQNIYFQESKKKADVNIINSDNGVKMQRCKRDFAWEKECRKYVLSIDAEWTLDKNGEPSSSQTFDNMATAIKWLTKTCALISVDEKLNSTFVIEQHTTQPYFLSPFNVLKNKTWIGDWLNIRIAIVLDDGTKIPFVFFKEAIITGQNEITLPNGELFIIPEEWFAKYAGLLMMATVYGDFLKIHKSQLGSLSTEIYGLEDCQEIDGDFDFKNENLPQKLNATLRPYQEEGVKWLMGNLKAKTGCCLADDMGLGKTIQTISLILKYNEECKLKDSTSKTGKKTSKRDSTGMADMFANLYAETTSTDEPADNLASSNKTVLIVCPSSLVYNWTNELQRFAPTLSICQYTGSVAERNKKADNLVLWDVVITTYHTALNDIDILATINFGIAVFDESQMFKNRNSQIYAAMSNITAEYRVALSGTPMENSLSELWSLMSVLNPLLLGDFKTFNKNFATPISENLLDTRSDILKKTIAPYFLRRTKEQVLADLPERQDEIIMCEMTDDQHSLYEEKMSAARNLAVSEKANDMSILAAIGRLRQIANHPQLIHEEDTDECNYDFRMSGKTMAIFSQMETVRGTKHKVLLFSEYVSFLNIIAKEMDRRGWKYEILTGETKNREQVINRFSNDENIQFFLISLKAGGVGLNLTCADYVFLLNPWWNKAAEEQAISRVHRIGQKHPIFVYRFVTRNTLEEKILLLQDHKQSLIESVMPFLK